MFWVNALYEVAFVSYCLTFLKYVSSRNLSSLIAREAILTSNHNNSNSKAENASITATAKDMATLSIEEQVLRKKRETLNNRKARIYKFVMSNRVFVGILIGTGVLATLINLLFIILHYGGHLDFSPFTASLYVWGVSEYLLHFSSVIVWFWDMSINWRVVLKSGLKKFIID